MGPLRCVLSTRLPAFPASAPAQLPWVPAWVARYASTNVRPWVKRKERKEWKRKDWTAKSSSDTIFQCRCNCNSASLDFEQQLLRKFRKLNLSIVKVRAKLVHVIFHYFVIWKTALHYNFKLLQSEHISAGAFTVNTAIFLWFVSLQPNNPLTVNTAIFQDFKYNVSIRCSNFSIVHFFFTFWTKNFDFLFFESDHLETYKAPIGPPEAEIIHSHSI